VKLTDHRVPRHATEIRLGWALLVVTAAVTGLLYWELTESAARFLRNEDWAAATGHLVFMGIVAALLYGSVVYQLTRIGSFQRRATFAPAADHQLSRTYHEAAGKLVVLVPSYNEEVKVVRRALMSAALQDYPRRRVVLLIDNPPTPQDAAELAALHAMRALPESLRQLFDQAAQPFVAALGQFEARAAESNLDLVSEAYRLAGLHRLAARWCLLQEAGFASGESADLLFRELVLRKAAEAHRAAAASLAWAARRGGLTHTRLQLEYHRLAHRFRVRLDSFERKRYANLSHEPNKAMNLNSYLGLMGGFYREVHRADGAHLQRAEVGVRFEDAEFVVTLDADSMTSPDYALRLIHELRQSGNARVAVAQTPYSSLPARFGTIEYVAGATTDIQYLIHQGFTRYRATYWVGANALLRKAALEDIVVTQMERGFPVKVYIQDRTVIEDTESSIDLIDKGWRLYNYPERLAFSATPPDFGALLIQRRRWANGGLIILPKLLRYLVRGPGRTLRAIEGFFRIHYLTSLAAVNFGLLVMMGIPFQTTALSLLWFPLSVCSRSRTKRLPSVRHRESLRAQSAADTCQPGRCLQVNPAGFDGPQDSFRAHTEGTGPHRRTAAVHCRGICLVRLVVRRSRAGRPGAALGACPVRTVQLGAARVRDFPLRRPSGKYARPESRDCRRANRRTRSDQFNRSHRARDGSHRAS